MSSAVIITGAKGGIGRALCEVFDFFEPPASMAQEELQKMRAR